MPLFSNTTSWPTLWVYNMTPLTITLASSDIYDHVLHTKRSYIFIFSSAECEESAILLCWPIVQSHEGKSALLWNTLPSTSVSKQEEQSQTADLGREHDISQLKVKVKITTQVSLISYFFSLRQHWYKSESKWRFLFKARQKSHRHFNNVSNSGQIWYATSKRHFSWFFIQSSMIWPILSTFIL